MADSESGFENRAARGVDWSSVPEIGGGLVKLNRPDGTLIDSLSSRLVSGHPENDWMGEGGALVPPLALRIYAGLVLPPYGAPLRWFSLRAGWQLCFGIGGFAVKTLERSGPRQPGLIF